MSQQQNADEIRQGLAAIDPEKGPTKSMGLGVRTGEFEAVEYLAGALGITRNAVIRLMIRYVLAELKAGRLDLTRFIHFPPPKPEINFPD